MVRMVAASNETPAVAETTSEDGAAPGDRLSGMQEATHRDEPSADRISGFEPTAPRPESRSGSIVPETEDGREAALCSVEIEISPSGSGVEMEPDPCADIPIMRELHLARGTMIADTYRIVRPLGAGGMGVVTLAHDDRLDRDVAIKFVRPELFKHQNLRDLFSVEARAMARVSHPNVLTVHTFGDHEGTPYFVMEYVDGHTVEQWLEGVSGRGGSPEIEEALRILDQACLGVEAIHAASTVHRDLKPSNLLIDANLHVAVSDLGVARILEGAAGADATCIVGSAAYMAPEAALGDDSKPELATRRDIYALGCIAYELLTGRPPFTGQTDMNVLSQHVLQEAVPPS